MAELNAIVRDGFDHEAFTTALAHHAGLRDQAQALSRLLPHGQALVEDLFCAVFKLTATLRPERALQPSALLNRAVVAGVIASAGLDALRRRTALDADESARAATRLAVRALEELKRCLRGAEGSLRAMAEAAADEADLQRLLDERETLATLSGPALDAAGASDAAPATSPDDARANAADAASGAGTVSEADAAQRRAALTADLDRDIARLRARRARHRQRLSAQATTLERVAEGVQAEADRLPGEAHDSDQHLRGLGLGAAGQVSAERRMELGRQVMRSDKLKRLARLAGALRELAMEVRRAHTSRAPQTLHTITRGSDLERLLPAELLGVSAGGARRALRVDFARRLAEGQLAHYELRAPAARGPMVVCLDGSGSMAGASELWSKAVALTLMDIARRERRRCLALIFSSGAEPFSVELLARGPAGARVRDEAVIDFAEHFPGGGTDFETPLARAVDAVTGRDYRRGDIVFITDGQAPVSDALVQRIEITRRRHRYRIHGILVDVGGHQRGTLERFADRVHTVTELTGEALRGLFIAV